MSGSVPNELGDFGFGEDGSGLADLPCLKTERTPSSTKNSLHKHLHTARFIVCGPTRAHSATLVRALQCTHVLLPLHGVVACALMACIREKNTVLTTWLPSRRIVPGKCAECKCMCKQVFRKWGCLWFFFPRRRSRPHHCVQW